MLQLSNAARQQYFKNDDREYGVDQLMTAFECLFTQVYSQVKIPSQWLVSKTKVTSKTLKTTGPSPISVQAQKSLKNSS